MYGREADRQAALQDPSLAEKVDLARVRRYSSATLEPRVANSSGVEIGGMSWLGILLASIGASLILGALTFVSTLIGALITAMIVLMCGPLIDRVLARRNRPPV
jgi:hypothetical protein